VERLFHVSRLSDNFESSKRSPKRSQAKNSPRWTLPNKSESANKNNKMLNKIVKSRRNLISYQKRIRLMQPVKIHIRMHR
jgi:hypothetical protein